MSSGRHRAAGCAANRIVRVVGPLIACAATGLALAVLGASGAAAHEPPVEPLFDARLAAVGPWPSDRLTVPDALQRTGLRVALPLPDCEIQRSACDDLRLLNELDGFDLEPRLAISFSGPIDPASVTSRSVFLVRLAPGPPEAVGVDRLVYDVRTHTLFARPETLLEPETRYGLVVTRELRAHAGGAIAASAAFHRALRGGVAPAYRRALRDLMAALGRRGVAPRQVAVASVFTTGSVTTFLEQARVALDRSPPPPALMTAPEEGGRAYFPRSGLAALTLARQVRVSPAGHEAVREEPLPLEQLPPDAVAGVGVGWYWAPGYLDGERRIPEGPTAGPPSRARVDVPVAFVIVLPAGTPPSGGWPLALVGHGYGGEMYSTVLRLAGTLARRGYAAAGVTVVGHGGGPESDLVVTGRNGTTWRVRVPGRGVDLDGDGAIGPTEGLTPRPDTPLGSLALRDGLRQQVVDLMAFVRAVRDGLDVDGDGANDVRGDEIAYVGQSLGGIYGTLLLAVDPRVSVGVLNVPGGSIAEIARLSPVFRPALRDALARRRPPLAERGADFREDLPFRGDEAVTRPAPAALPIQEYLAWIEWLGRRGDAVAYARHLRLLPLGEQEPKRVLIQLAWGDRVVPNPTSSALVRAGHLADRVALLRADRLAPALSPELREPHGFLLRAGAPGAAGAVARAAQEQVARFFATGGAAIWDPDGAVPPPFREPVFEVPAGPLPEQPVFVVGPERE